MLPHILIYFPLGKNRYPNGVRGGNKEGKLKLNRKEFKLRGKRKSRNKNKYNMIRENDMKIK